MWTGDVNLAKTAEKDLSIRIIFPKKHHRPDSRPSPVPPIPPLAWSSSSSQQSTEDAKPQQPVPEYLFKQNAFGVLANDTINQKLSQDDSALKKHIFLVKEACMRPWPISSKLPDSTPSFHHGISHSFHDGLSHPFPDKSANLSPPESEVASSSEKEDIEVVVDSVPPDKILVSIKPWAERNGSGVKARPLNPNPDHVNTLKEFFSKY